MTRKQALLILVALAINVAFRAGAQDSLSVLGPTEHVYATHGGVDLKAYVFSPVTDESDPQRSAIVIFHGGGWHIGSPEWSFSRAKHFAGRGMVAVAAQYRLSDQKSITPLEAMADARAVLRWMRSNADNLGISTDRIAAYGWSAGAHLAACAAIFDDSPPDVTVSCAPNALILFSPAVSLAGDNWARRLLGSRASIGEISPDEHVRKGLPPTIILQGRTDTVTPLAGVQRFSDRMQEAGNRCDLHVYDGVGHLFTPESEPDNGMPNPDLEVQAAAYDQADQFLESIGFIAPPRD
jgi:acetyl esterase/lipase